MSAEYNPANNFEVQVSDMEFRSAGHQTWLARVYAPVGSGPFPAALFVHGGAWSGGDRTQGGRLNQDLAASGIVIVAIDLRLAPRHPYPAQVVDVNYAMRWLKHNADKFGADGQCVGVIGSSSGGHTAVLSAMQPYDSKYGVLTLDATPAPDAAVSWVIALWPVLDPYARFIYAREARNEGLVMATNGYFLTEDAMREGNPQTLLDREERVSLPPILVIQGTADANIPLQIPQRFAESYRLAGGELDLELFPEMPHTFANSPGPESDRALRIMKAWISRTAAPSGT